MVDVTLVRGTVVVWFLIKEQCPGIKEAPLSVCRVSTSSYMRERRPEGVSWYDFVVLRTNIEEGLDSEEEQWVTGSESESDTSESESDTSESDLENGQDD